MKDINKLITDNIDIWSSAVSPKASTGRGSNKKVELSGIKSLRNLILELAIQGKLVKVDNKGVNPQKLLDQILDAKTELIQQKKLKKQKSLPSLSEEEIIFQAPEGWIWTRLGEVTNYGVADKAEPTDVDDNCWVLELEDVEKSTSKLIKRVRFSERKFKSSKNRFASGDVIYGKLRPYLDKVIVADEAGVCTTEMIPIRAYANLDSRFLRLIMKTPYFIDYANNSTHGMNLPRIGTDKARLAPIIIAPIEEQKLIVKKVDELMSLCDQLEQRTEASSDAHQLLVEELLSTLTNSENAQEFEQNWARIAEHFDLLFTTEHSIEQLRQTILQLAVMGKLVPICSTNETSAELLLRVESERKRLVAEEKLKTKANPKINAEDMYIKTPEQWHWCRLGNLAKFIDYRGKTPTKLTSGVRLITAKNVKFGFISLEPEEFISEDEYITWMTRGFPRVGDILFTPEAPLGNVAIIDISERFALAQRAICFQFHDEHLSPFVKLVLMSKYFQDQLIENSSGMTARGIKASKLKEIPIPIPPLSEQHKIVKVVSELNLICEQLSKRLADSRKTQVNLSEAIVANALN